MQRFGFINWVDEVDWPPQGDKEAGVLGGSIRANWFTRTLYWGLVLWCLKYQLLKFRHVQRGKFWDSLWVKKWHTSLKFYCIIAFFHYYLFFRWVHAFTRQETFWGKTLRSLRYDGMLLVHVGCRTRFAWKFSGQIFMVSCVFFPGLLDSVNCAHQVRAGQWLMV